MLSRIANSGRLLQTGLMKNRIVIVTNYSSNAPSTAPAASAVVEAGQGNKYPLDDLGAIGSIIMPPRLPTIETNVVDNIEECKPSKSIGEQIGANFGPNMPTIDDDKRPERDLVNYPRVERPENPEGVRIAVLPESWFTAFYDKTGVTGPYLFFGGLTTFLVSKEFLIMEHEMVVGFTLAVIFAAAINKFKDPVREYFSKIDDATVDSWNQYQQGNIKLLKDYIELEKKAQKSLEGQKILFDAKRENIHLQCEAEYRRRLKTVHDEVRRKLEYQIAAQNSAKQFSQKHMVNWIIDNVSKGISAQQEKDAMSKCIADLKTLSVKKAGVI